MTVFRLISIPLNGAVELAIGLALATAPLALGASSTGAIAAVLAGAVMIGMAFAKAVESLPVRAQYEYDWTLVAVLVGGAILLAIAGQPIATLAFGIAALAQLVLNLVTRYSATR